MAQVNQHLRTGRTGRGSGAKSGSKQDAYSIGAGIYSDGGTDTNNSTRNAAGVYGNSNNLEGVSKAQIHLQPINKKNLSQ